MRPAMWNPLQLLGNYARGLLMGGADVVPGVSGGTVALIVGIYERLIRSIRLGASALLRGVRLDFAGSRQRFGEVEWRLILPLGAGIATALVIGARIIPPLLETQREPVFAIFFGLILGSVVVPLRRIERVGWGELALIAGAAVGAFVVVGLPPREIADPPLIYVFVAAAIAICAMILPGVSGAFLLLVMGIYRPTLDAVTALNLPYVLTFMAGAVIGLGSFARVLEWLLVHRHSMTMAALTGLMIGGVRALWPWQTEDRAVLMPPDVAAALIMAMLAAVGFIAVLLLVRAGGSRVAAPAEPRAPGA
jgi:putative membrane protein